MMIQVYFTKIIKYTRTNQIQTTPTPTPKDSHRSHFGVLPARHFSLQGCTFSFIGKISSLPNCLQSCSSSLLINTDFYKYSWDPVYCPHTHFCFCLPSCSPRPGPFPVTNPFFHTSSQFSLQPWLHMGRPGFHLKQYKGKGCFPKTSFSVLAAFPATIRFAFSLRAQVPRANYAPPFKAWLSSTSEQRTCFSIFLYTPSP